MQLQKCSEVKIIQRDQKKTTKCLKEKTLDSTGFRILRNQTSSTSQECDDADGSNHSRLSVIEEIFNAQPGLEKSSSYPMGSFSCDSLKEINNLLKGRRSQSLESIKLETDLK
jgi:hypothetical protein